MTDFAKAAELNPKSALPYLYRAKLYEEKDENKVIADVTKAIMLEPDLADSYLIRGAAYAAVRNYRAAQADFNKALALKPDYAENYNQRGAMYCGMNNFAAAVKDFSSAISANDKNLYNARFGSQQFGE